MPSEVVGQLASWLYGSSAPDWTSTDLPAETELCVDGARFSALLRVDREEHDRRRRLGLGAATSTGLLHALWNLPWGMSFPRSVLDPADLATLTELGQGWVEDREGLVTRRYQPAGTVQAIAVIDSDLARAISRAAAHSPTARRHAVWSTPRELLSGRAIMSLRHAVEVGVGVTVSGNWGSKMLVEPAAPLVGRPAVFRWWQAEIAYRNWIKRIAPTAGAAPSA
jgi:hypothetical protein